MDFDELASFYQKGLFCDLRLVFKGPRHIFCHKLVLASAVPTLKSILVNTDQELPPDQEAGSPFTTLILPDCDPEVIQQALGSIYQALSSKDFSVSTDDEVNWTSAFGLSKQVASCVSHQDASSSVVRQDAKCDPQRFIQATDVVTQNDNSVKLLDGNCVTTKDANYIEAKVKKSKVAETEKTCSECDLVFPYSRWSEKQAFQQHLTTEHFNCDCDIRFGDKKAFLLHVKAVHKGNKDLSVEEIKRKKAAAKLPAFQCPQCKARLSSEKFLQRHIKTVHTTTKKENITVQQVSLTPGLQQGGPFSCQHCDRKFLHQRSMLEHNRNFHLQTKCSTCDAVFEGNLSLLKHQRESHVAPAICEHCGRHFKHRKYLRDHVVRSHLPDYERPFVCKLCPRGFLNQLQLDDHVARLHEGRRPYVCRFQGCNRSFTLTGTRKRHEKRDHNLCIDLKRGMRSKSEVHTAVLVHATLPPPQQATPTLIIHQSQQLSMDKHEIDVVGDLQPHPPTVQLMTSHANDGVGGAPVTIDPGGGPTVVGIHPGGGGNSNDPQILEHLVPLGAEAAATSSSRSTAADTIVQNNTYVTLPKIEF